MLYFPLKERLHKLLQVEKYLQMCQHEGERPQPIDDDYMYDVYDAPAWKQFMGPVTYPNNRLGLIFCMDAWPAFECGSFSVKTGGAMNASLPPTERGKPENILLMVVLPTAIKDDAQKKYFDFMADHELTSLYNDGVDGMKVKVFTSSMDSPGRSELMGMFTCLSVRVCVIACLFSQLLLLCLCAGLQSCTAYQGCPICLHSFSPGSTLHQTKCVCDGYRRFLAVNSRGRLKEFPYRGHVYQYGTIETRQSPVYRDNELAMKACAYAERIGAAFLGHKRTPLTAGWPGFDIRRYCPGEMMHDEKVIP